MHRAFSLRSVLIIAFAAAVGARAQVALPKDSPFMPAPGAAVVDQPSNDTLELKGFSSTGKQTLVCIYDNQLKRSHWIAVEATEAGIKVLGFNAAKEEVDLIVGGQKKTLKMRRPTVAAGVNNAGAAAAGFAAPAPIVTQGTPQPPPAPGSIAQQETEARMLVSDLLEIGIQQRKAYEEAQKKADQEKAAAKKN